MSEAGSEFHKWVGVEEVEKDYAETQRQKAIRLVDLEGDPTPGVQLTEGQMVEYLYSVRTTIRDDPQWLRTEKLVTLVNFSDSDHLQHSFIYLCDPDKPDDPTHQSFAWVGLSPDHHGDYVETAFLVLLG